jgi:predicted phage terminase large subunit-like protein
MTDSGTLLSLIRQVRAQRATKPDALEDERLRLEGSLIEFVEEAWPFVDAAPYQQSWAIEALCEHLQAITDGRISRLLINFPPRCGKTNITSVIWPAWTWARRERSFRSSSSVRFLCGSYGHTLALSSSNLTRRLILSPWYQRLWGHRFDFREDMNTKSQFDLSTGGSRLSTSVGGSLLGIGGDIIIVDDPHNVAQAESEAERETVLNWWSELSTTRLNDPRQSAITVVMQRLHESDVSGTILSGDDSERWTHLMIPMRYDPQRHCATSLGWNDPRGLADDGNPLVVDGQPRDAAAAAELAERDGELLWPERFGEKEVAAIEAGLGPYMASGRLEQSPQPKGGGIFKSEWWGVWEGTHFPIIDFVIASLDSAFTEKQENDPSALTVWGTFRHPDTGKTRVILIDAWRKHLSMHGSATPRLDHEIPQLGDDEKVKRYKATLFAKRVGGTWGLVEWVSHTMRKWGANILLIEGKASGLTVHQELRRLHADENWSVQLVNPKGDKVVRALAAQPTFAQGLVYAPVKDWSQLVIDEMSLFPKGRYDDLTDSTTMAIAFLRSSGILRTDAEEAASEAEAVRHRPQRRLQSLYPC